MATEQTTRKIKTLPTERDTAGHVIVRKRKRHARRSDAEKREILRQASKLEYGKQKPYLKKLGLRTSHLQYWREKFGIEV